MSMATRTETQSPALHVADSHDLIRVQGAVPIAIHPSAQKGSSPKFALRPAIKSLLVGTCEAFAQ
jgi:hypothetical protein